jgi:hypothetical protein
MTISASEYASMAAGSYGPFSGEDPIDKMIKFSGGLIDRDSFTVLESTDASTVFRKNATGEVVVAIRGAKKLGDWASNTLILFGALSSDPRTIVLINTVRKYKRMGVDVSVTGHSLGGALASEIARNENVLGVTFNKGSGVSETTPVSAVLSKYRGETGGNVINFLTGTDPLSIGTVLHVTSGSKTFFVLQKGIRPHIMDNFSGLDDQLYEEEINTRGTTARDYRKSHPNEKMDDYSMNERLSNGTYDLLKVMDMVDKLYSLYRIFRDTGQVYGTRHDIPANFMDKVRALGNRARSLFGELSNLRKTRSFTGFLDNLRGIKSEAGQLVRDVQFDRVMQDLWKKRDSVPEIGEENEFKGYEEMEWYDERLDEVADFKFNDFDSDPKTQYEHESKHDEWKTDAEDRAVDAVNDDIGIDGGEGIDSGEGLGFPKVEPVFDELPDGYMDRFDRFGDDDVAIDPEKFEVGDGLSGPSRRPNRLSDYEFDFDDPANEEFTEFTEIDPEEAVGFDEIEYKETPTDFFDENLGMVDADIGGLEAAEIGVVDTAQVLGVVLEGLSVVLEVGGVFLLGYALNAMVQAEAERKQRVVELKESIQASNAIFDERFTSLTRQVHLNPRLLVPLKPVENGFYSWSSQDMYGDVVIKYLEWRVARPELYYAGMRLELDVMRDLYFKYFSPGVPLIAPPDNLCKNIMLNQNRKQDGLQKWLATSPSGLETYKSAPTTRYNPRFGPSEGFNMREKYDNPISDGWNVGTFFTYYNKITEFNISLNADGFNREFKQFLSVHQTHNYDEMGSAAQKSWSDRVKSRLEPGLRDYVDWVLSLPDVVQAIFSENFVRSDTPSNIRLAMGKFVSVVVGLMMQHRGRENEKLLDFEKTHTRAILFRGFEELTSVRGLDAWLSDRGEGLDHFQVYFSLGSRKLLQDPSRSIQEQVSRVNLIQHHIDWDNLDYSAFIASGQKPMGDTNETRAEFVERFERWQAASGRAAAFDSHTFKPVNAVYTVQSAPQDFSGAGVPPPASVPPPAYVIKQDSDGTLWSCPLPRKKLKMGPGPPGGL